MTKEQMLDWMNRKYPDGFYWSDLRKKKTFSGMSFSALTMLHAPLLFHLHAFQLQNLIGRLMEYGLSPRTPCHVPEENISGTLGDVALRTRKFQLDSLFLVIAEEA